MTVGVADTPWHPQFFIAATFESQRLTQDGTTIDPSHGLRLEEDPVAHFVILPIYQEDVTVLHETLESWLLFFGRETHANCVSDGPATSFEDVMATCHPPRIAEEVDCASPNTQFAFRKLWKKCVVELHQRDLSRVFMTVGVADTFWHPQLFSTVTFESQRSTEEERSWSLKLSRASHGGDWPPPSRTRWPTIIRLELLKRLLAPHPTPSGPFRQLWKK